jgi:hypothetical protein
VANLAARAISWPAVCVEMVAQSDVYDHRAVPWVPVRDRSDVSYIEREFEAGGE